MTRRTRLVSFLMALWAATTVAVRDSRAWDSVADRRIRAIPRPAPEDTAASAWLNPTVPPRFSMQVAKDAIGGAGQGPDEHPLTKLLRCDASFGPRDGNQRASLTGCAVASRALVDGVQPTWLVGREAADLPEVSEHYLISRAAADLAHLTTSTKIFDPHWVRYPGRNAYVGTPLGFDGQKVPTSYLVAQSALPVGLNGPGYSWETRSFSLLEMSEVPDFSFSLGDWLAGNEICPIGDFTGSFHDANAVDACHNYTLVLGPSNVTHFFPMNREVWSHYHDLALTRMARCKSMAGGAGFQKEFYGAWEDLFNDGAVGSSQDTEIHECEREAMAYELYGDHFLQDAWSTGHMWTRWGKARFSDFPIDPPLPNVGFPPIPPANEGPRRAALAGTTAALVGMIHGAKAIVYNKARASLGATAAEALNVLGVLDDPLNGPIFDFTKYVQWVDPSVAPAIKTTRGAGDLFWAPPQPAAASVSTGAGYAEQRSRILHCSAASMLEVYRAGPQAHGVVDDLAVADVLAVDPHSASCWGQLDTNESMVAAIGAFPKVYGAVPSAGQWLLEQVVNEMVVDTLGQGIGFPTGDSSGDPETQARIDDRKHFFDRLKTAVTIDLAGIEASYRINGVAAPQGTTSALGAGPFGPIKLFGMAPIPDVRPAPSPPRNVDYADQLQTLSTPPLDDPNLEAQARAMSRFFWRGNLDLTCAESGANSAEIINALRARCQSRAASGGDPEACTACVALTEPHIPQCDLDNPSSSVVRDSKCSLAAIDSAGIAVAGFPEIWWDNHARVFGTPELGPSDSSYSPNACAPPIYMATAWCTGVAERREFSSHMVAQTQPFEMTSAVECGDGFFSDQRVFGISRYRHARVMIESDWSSSQPWLFPMVTAYDQTVTTTPGADACNRKQTVETDSLRDRVVAGIAPLGDAEHYAGDFYAGADIPRCGILERASFWNKDCSTAFGALGTTSGYTALYSSPGSYYQPTAQIGPNGEIVPGPPDTNIVIFEMPTEPIQTADGSYGIQMDTSLLPGYAETVSACYVREPRVLIQSCGAGARCTPGGECVANVGPPEAAEIPGFIDFAPPHP